MKSVWLVLLVICRDVVILEFSRKKLSSSSSQSTGVAISTKWLVKLSTCVRRLSQLVINVEISLIRGFPSLSTIEILVKFWQSVRLISRIVLPRVIGVVSCCSLHAIKGTCIPSVTTTAAAIAKQMTTPIMQGFFSIIQFQ